MNFVCLICCLTSTVNSYGHVGTVSYPYHTFSGQAKPKRLTITQCPTEVSARGRMTVKYFMTNLDERIFEPRREKTNVLVSDQVRHKPGCTATEDGYMLEISDLGSRGIVLSV